MGDALCDQFPFVNADEGFHHHHAGDGAHADDLFSILETWEDCAMNGATSACGSGGGGGVDDAHAQQLEPAAGAARNSDKRPAPADKDGLTLVMSHHQEGEGCGGGSPAAAPAPQKRQKCSPASSPATDAAGKPKTAPPPSSHIAVERNRRKQMNENLVVLRSLMPCFYVKRGDQASIIGGVVEYIKELQQVLHSLEAKKQRKVYTDQVLSPRPPPPPASSCCSPRPPLSPRLPPQLMLKSTPPISPRLAAVPISPCRTPPTPGSPYYNRQLRLPPLPPTQPPEPVGSAYMSPAMTPTATHDPAASPRYQLPSPSLDAVTAELLAYTTIRQLALAAAPAGLLPDVKVEFAGANLVLNTVSHRSPGQAVKIIAALEGRSLEILQAKISTVDDTAVNSFTVKIGIECELSAEELVQEIQRTFT